MCTRCKDDRKSEDLPTGMIVNVQVSDSPSDDALTVTSYPVPPFHW